MGGYKLLYIYATAISESGASETQKIYLDTSLRRVGPRQPFQPKPKVKGGISSVAEPPYSVSDRRFKMLLRRLDRVYLPTKPKVHQISSSLPFHKITLQRS